MYGVGGVIVIKVFGMCFLDVNISCIVVMLYIGFLVWFGFFKIFFMVFISK